MFTRGLLAAICLLEVTLYFPASTWAQAPSADEAAPPDPVTVDDPTIAVDHLELLVKPLTRDELAVEAGAWRDLLKAQVQEISDLQLRLKDQKEKIEKIEEQADDSEAAAAADAETPGKEAGPEDAAEIEASSEQEQEQKKKLTEELPLLNEQRTALVDRLNVVLDAWEAKGGETEEYRQYVTAVSGLELDVTDAETTWAAIKGWVTSEQGGRRWLWNIGKFLLILFAFYLLAQIVGKIVERATSRIKGASELLKNFLAGLVRQAVLLVGVIIAVSALELNISPLLAAIGGAAFVIGLALQGTLSNFASGMIILGYRPFDVGDVVEAAGISGIVDSMNLISTKIRTFDNKVMIVPNNKIATDTITNASASTTRRVDMVFGIGYSDNAEQAREILESIVSKHELVLDDPAPVVKLNELADSSVNFVCRPWTKAGDYWTVYWDITRQVKEEFDSAGISIPFPQRDVHVYQEAGGNGASQGREEQHA